ncbi:hypothetical protein GGR56DRAFT_665201 [Xylariaceae sp. FL0804]|nr:hypothetical protein GGR56DRAFT_665201 [Xylariaceae sp. FL0804]
MWPLRHRYQALALTIVCLCSIFLAARNIGEWSLESPYHHLPSIRYPHGLVTPNSTVSKADYGPLRRHPIDHDCDTGATESYAKVPAQLMTNLKCIRDFLLFSDMRQVIAGFEVYDSLDDVLPEVQVGNPDFDLYRRQRACPIAQESCQLDHDHSARQGWSLDRYKNIHIVEKTYRLRPGYDWYLFIDADSYVLWRNLVQWLQTLDPSKRLYIGSVSLIANFRFAHGGSGYLLSQAAMRDFAGSHPGIANRYDDRVRDFCCGDYMLAVALNETIGLQWPTFNGEKPHTIPFGPRQWCQPVEFETRFSGRPTHRPSMPQPVLLRDVFHEFVGPQLQPRREDWDNISETGYYREPGAEHEDSDDDGRDERQVHRAHEDHHHGRHRLTAVERSAHKSFEHCQKMCDDTKGCFQFSYHDGICAYHRGFLLGRPARGADTGGRGRTSGWNIDTIESWVRTTQAQCKEPPAWPRL